MAYNEILLNLIDYYANLLIVQYHNKPKATATIKLLAKLLLANLILLRIRDCFDWKTAIGAQLDIIGKWVGISRFYDGQKFEEEAWFALIDWDRGGDNLQGGFSTFSDFETLEGGFLDYPNLFITQNQLSDNMFRQVIGLKIIKNNINCTEREIDNAIWNYFKGKVYTVWEPHVLAYYYPSDLRGLFSIALSKEVLPCPTGCKIDIREIINNG